MTSDENTDLVAPEEDPDEVTNEIVEELILQSSKLAEQMNPLHVQFAENMLRDKSLTRSWQEAGDGITAKPSSALGRARMLLKQADVQEYLRLRRREIAERTNITAERIEEELAYVAFSRATDVMSWGKDGVAFIPSDDLSPELAASVQSVKSRRRTKVLESGEEVSTVELELKMHSKLDALEKLVKIRGLYQADRKNDADVQRELLATVVMRFVMNYHLQKGVTFHEAMKYAEQNPEQVEAWGKEVKLLNA